MTTPRTTARTARTSLVAALVLVAAGCAERGSPFERGGSEQSGVASAEITRDDVGATTVGDALTRSATANGLPTATAAYLASPGAVADAYLVGYARAFPIEQVLARPGGCEAWFAAARPPTAVASPEAEPPAGAFDDLLLSLRRARLEMALRRVRCATDPTPGRLPETLAEVTRGWDALLAYARSLGLVVPVPTPVAPHVPPEPVVVRGSGPSIVRVAKPTEHANDPVLLDVAGPGPVRVVAVSSTGVALDEPTDGRGTHLLDSGGNEPTTALRIDADGPWTVTLRSLGLVRRAALPGEIAGDGPDVVLLDLSLLGDARRVDLSGATDAWVHPRGRGAQPFVGTLPDGDLAVLEVRAAGTWRLATP